MTLCLRCTACHRACMMYGPRGYVAAAVRCIRAGHNAAAWRPNMSATPQPLYCLQDGCRRLHDRASGREGGRLCGRRQEASCRGAVATGAVGPPLPAAGQEVREWHRDRDPPSAGGCWRPYLASSRVDRDTLALVLQRLFRRVASACCTNWCGSLLLGRRRSRLADALTLSCMRRSINCNSFMACASSL